MTTLTLSEIDHPPCWLDQHSLKVTASGCLLDVSVPGEFVVWLDEEHLIELYDAWLGGPDEFEDIMLHADLAEAVDDLIAATDDPIKLHDWARHLEMLAARLRQAAR